jgi:hypothetical protein
LVAASDAPFERRWLRAVLGDYSQTEPFRVELLRIWPDLA